MHRTLPINAARPRAATRPADAPRLSAFDAIRGLAAVAVVVLHASYAYCLHPMPGLIWPVPIDQPSYAADCLFWAIEGCIMPLFFVMSGYFAARSLEKKSPRAMFAGRTRRLVRPMLSVGLAVLILDANVWAAGLVSTGRATLRNWYQMRFPWPIGQDFWGLSHLWYVQYLWLLCGLFCAATALARHFESHRTASGFRAASFQRRGSPVVHLILLATALAMLLTCFPQIVLGFQHQWLPAGPKFLHAGLFFLGGVRLFHSPRLLESMRVAVPLTMGVALISFVVWLPLGRTALIAGRAEAVSPLLGTMLAAYAISATAAVLGAGLRWLDAPVPTLGKLATASFWIYLVHHPIVGMCHLALRPLPASPFVKLFTALSLTLGLCIWTYTRFVQGRAIERLLDGVPLRQTFVSPPTPTAPKAAPGRRAA